jgi:hypothetical protein
MSVIFPPLITAATCTVPYRLLAALPVYVPSLYVAAADSVWEAELSDEAGVLDVGIEVGAEVIGEVFAECLVLKTAIRPRMATAAIMTIVFFM